MFLALIVEDNTAFRENLYVALHARFPFIELVQAAGVRAALTEVGRDRPDLIFIDVHLGDGNGLDLTRRLRISGVDSMIIMLALHDLPEYRDEALRSGADRFMVKSQVDFCAVFDVVQSLLTLHFRALIVAEESAFEARMRAFLSRAVPGTVIACATEVDEALMIARTLNPNLVVLCTAAGAERERSFCESVHGDRANGGATVVSVYDSGRDAALECPTDYCMDKNAAFSQEMTAIIDTLLAVRGQPRAL